jgi:hypothetical protein
MVMVMGLMRRKHPRLAAQVAAVMVAALTHAPS